MKVSQEVSQRAFEDMPLDVIAFAAEQGAQAELPAVVEVTRRIFSAAAVSIELDDDPEIADDRHIVIVTKGIRLPVVAAQEAIYEWQRELFTLCPAPLTWVFRLGVEGAQ